MKSDKLSMLGFQGPRAIIVYLQMRAEHTRQAAERLHVGHINAWAYDASPKSHSAVQTRTPPAKAAAINCRAVREAGIQGRSRGNTNTELVERGIEHCPINPTNYQLCCRLLPKH